MSIPTEYPNPLLAELIAVIENEQPSSLIYCAREPVPALEALAETGCRVVRADRVASLEQLPRFDLGVVFDCVEHLPAAEGRQLVGRLRNVHCSRLWLAVPESPQWQLTSLIGLGFRRMSRLPMRDGDLCSYSYDIDKYNHKREWNTPKHWANPQNWGKYWW